jgi:hypothetical protein
MLARDESEADAIHSASEVDVGDQQGKPGTELPQDKLRGFGALASHDDYWLSSSRTEITCRCDASPSTMCATGRIGLDCPTVVPNC